MKRLIALLALAIAAACAVALTPAAAASAATGCTFTPVLPSRVVINQDVKGLTAKLRPRAGCPALNGYTLLAETYLVHTTDSYWLMWDETLRPDVESVYAFTVRPGTYRTTASSCDLYDPDFNVVPCSVSGASTVIKFAGRPKLAVTRSGRKRIFHARATRYTANGWAATTATVRIQRLVGGRWRTVHTAVAEGRSGYTWTHRYSKVARYRALQPETSATFPATSGTVRR